MTSPWAGKDKRNRFGAYVSQGVFLLQEQEGRAQPNKSDHAVLSVTYATNNLSHDGRVLSAQLPPCFLPLAGELLAFLLYSFVHPRQDV